MSDRASAVPRSGLRNILRNVAWLLGGKGFGAVCSLIYLAILSRSLGLKDFGHFSLIFGTGQALVAIASFQTWQTVVRFGAQPVHDSDWRRFGRLTWFCATIDLSGVLLGSAIAAVVYYGFGGALSLNPAYIHMAFAFNCALLVSRMTTPMGVVRVLDRFDVGSYVEAVVPAGRLMASAFILWHGATVGKFLLAWAVFDLLSAALYWIAARRLVPEALHRAQFGHWRETMNENPGLAGFFGMTFASSTLDALVKQGPLLAVGYFLGTTAAGLYRLADQLAQGISRFAQLLARAVFPEFAMANVREGQGGFGKLVRQVSLMSGAAGAIVTILAAIAGGPLLMAIGGAPFAQGAPILLPLVIGAAFELAAVSFEPVLFASARAHWAVMVRIFAVATLFTGILLFVPFGPVGISWAVALGMAAAYAGMAFAVSRTLRRYAA